MIHLQVVKLKLKYFVTEIQPVTMDYWVDEPLSSCLATS